MFDMKDDTGPVVFTMVGTSRFGNSVAVSMIAVGKGGFHKEDDSGHIQGDGNDDFIHSTNV